MQVALRAPVGGGRLDRRRGWIEFGGLPGRETSGKILVAIATVGDWF